MNDQLCRARHFQMGSACAASAYLILYYDYFLTLSKEVDRFWHPRPHTWASIVFFANRYIALLGHVPFLYRVYGDPCKVVHIQPFLARYHAVLMLILHFLTSVLLVMRVSALYLRNKWILSFLAVEAVAAMSVGCWVVTKPAAGYGTDLQKSLINPRLQASAFSALLVFDFTVFILSTYRSITLRRHNQPFLNRLFVDGFVYYGVTWSVNLLNVIVLATIDPSKDWATSVFANVLSVVMVSRIMINLRDPILHKSTGRGQTVEADTTSLAGDVSTFVLDGILFASATRTDLSIELDLIQENSPGSMPHGAC